MSAHSLCHSVLVLFFFVLPLTISFPLPVGNLTFALEIGVPVVIQHRSPFRPVLDDPPSISQMVSNVKSLTQKTEDALSTTPTSQAQPNGHDTAWYAVAALALLLILMTGLLAGLTLAVMSVDMTRLRVWTRTGSLKRQLVLFLHVLVSQYAPSS